MGFKNVLSIEVMDIHERIVNVHKVFYTAVGGQSRGREEVTSDASVPLATGRCRAETLRAGLSSPGPAALHCFAPSRLRSIHPSIRRFTLVLTE